MTTAAAPAPIFPGGTSVTRLAVYDDAAPDGVAGGTPHLHTASTEAYVVTSGYGSIQTISPEGFQETALRPGSVAWFTPGTIHRAVSHRDLEVLVIMSNAGLPEAGDAVMTFPDHIVSDPVRYRDAASLPPAGSPESELLEAARRRRDLGVEGFVALKAAAETDPQAFNAALNRFYAHATALVAPKASSWRDIWESTVAKATAQTDQALTALAEGRSVHLLEAALAEVPPSSGIRSFGMCGRLRTYNVQAG
ncbi:cupin domain-containing protein [Paenarthrobacter aurescens]|jgi:mannose-6-phosphate isomerase-like protein (cupin superfamily)|uniref:Cupin domain protein n=1 Tax=Paenarthrobacter aurescens (strain TC1) TaxID=290340 RepID=A1RDH6_PAEAT|nr:cupin domain-containing protein [Paenarthrobacter aurescens]ABM10671.1 putative cupin domain protein [Paenarthrobacter aurescens TC1]